MKNKDYNAIDLMKFISAFLVIGIHTGPLLDINVFANFVFVQILARLAVPFFFITSGYFFFLKIDSSKGYKDKGNLTYLKTYLLRIFKIYIIWSILYLPFNIVALYQAESINIASMVGYLRDFLFTGSFYHLWFLPALLFAISVVYVLICKVGTKVTFILSIVLYGIGMLGNIYPTFLAEIPGISNVFALYMKVFTTTRNGLFFGMIFVVGGAIFAQHTITRSKHNLGVLFSISFALLVAECLILRELGNMQDLSSMYIMLFPTVATLFLLLTRIDLKPRTCYKEMRTLSLLIYVSHIIFVTILLWCFPTLNSLLVYAISVGCSLALSYVIYIVSLKIPVLKNLY